MAIVSLFIYAMAENSSYVVIEHEKDQKSKNNIAVAFKLLVMYLQFVFVISRIVSTNFVNQELAHFVIYYQTIL